MLNKKFIGVILAVFALIFIPTVALAQTEMEYDWGWESDWDTTQWDDDYWDTTYDYSPTEITEEGLMAILGAFAIVGVVTIPIFLVIYIYQAVAFMAIAKKLNHPNPWFAWIPILNVIQMFQLADMSGWLVLLMIIPIVNIVLMIIALMKICEKRGMEKLLALLALLGPIYFILIGILAWKND